MNERLLKKIDFYSKLAKKYAAAPEFVKLKDDKRSKLWFGDQVSKSNDDKFFAILDRDNILSIKKMVDSGYLNGGPFKGSFFIDGDEIYSWYLKNDKTQEIIQFIVNRYNKYFPKLNGFTVLSNLQNDGILDPDSGANSPNPIFILVHDLIHQVLQSNFVASLTEQRNREEHGLYVSLIDELYEDIASSLSNFQPKIQYIGQGIINYLKNTFRQKWGSQKSNSDRLRKVIEDVLYQAKAELRGKVDSLVNKHVISNEKIPSQIKQLVDGILSRIKYQMLQQLDGVNDDATVRNLSTADQIFNLFDFKDISEQYYNRIMTSQIVEQADSSALRAWMLECLGAMQKLNQYFKYGLIEELENKMKDLEEE